MGKKQRSSVKRVVRFQKVYVLRSTKSGAKCGGLLLSELDNGRILATVAFRKSEIKGSCWCGHDEKPQGDEWNEDEMLKRLHGRVHIQQGRVKVEHKIRYAATSAINPGSNTQPYIQTIRTTLPDRSPSAAGRVGEPVSCKALFSRALFGFLWASINFFLA